MKILAILIPILIGVGVIALIIWLVKKFERKRTADLAQIAEEMSLDFFPTGDPVLESALAHLSLMQRGHGRKLYNLIRGQTQSVDLSLFDYQYTTGRSKHKTTHTLSVVAFESPLLDLPAFELGPENFLHRLAGIFGYQDIDFAGYPTFNKKYLLRGPNENAIRQLFTEQVVQHFEAQLAERKKTPEVIGQGHRLMVSTGREKPVELRIFLEQAFATYGVLKSEE